MQASKQLITCVHFGDGGVAAVDPSPAVVVVAGVAAVGLPAVQLRRLVHAGEEHVQRLD